MRLPVSFFCLLSFLCSLRAEQLDELRQAYQARLLQSQEQVEQEQESLQQKYLQVLEQQKQGFQQEGNLDALLHIDQQIARVKTSPQPMPRHLINRDPYLSELRQAYARAWDQRSEAWNQRNVALKEAYLQRLDAEVITLTRAGRIEEAKAVKQEAEEQRAMGRAVTLRETTQGAEEGQKPVENKVLQFGGKSYVFVQKICSWHEAKALAEQMGGHLFIVNSLEEFEAVVPLKGHHRVWIGAYEVEPKKRKWIDGTEMKAIKGIRFSFSSKEQSEPAITIAQGNRISDTQAEGSRKVRGFILERPQ